MSEAVVTLGPYLFIVLAGMLPTIVWRWIGVFAAGRLKQDDEIFVWVRAVANALVAGVIARLILFPTGALAATPTELRIGAAIVGLVAFLIAGSRIYVGVLAAEAVLIGGWFLLFV